ncbi:MAG TPA: TlyA family RNA methyltransferase, partial [Bacillota bacterium]|nr:TlyA family RNA methyltransferase [Bacillota bacterium]
MENNKIQKQRADLYLVEQGYFASREQAQRSIMAGEVSINGKRIEKPGQMIVIGAGQATNSGDSTGATAGAAGQPPVQISGGKDAFVSRGGHKLKKAITVFQITVVEKICLDAGASTGGFTDCLLQEGATHVYAVDVGYGQLAWKLRQDPRVTVFERENIRFFDGGRLPIKPGIITADLSFISLGLVLPRFLDLIAPQGDLVTLIKPQFEAGKDKVGKKGVVRDSRIHVEVLERLVEYGPEWGWSLLGLDYSPLLGPEGNIEYLGHWRPAREVTGSSGLSKQ